MSDDKIVPPDRLRRARLRVAKDRGLTLEEYEASQALPPEPEPDPLPEKKPVRKSGPQSDLTSRPNPGGAAPTLHNAKKGLEHLGVRCSFDEFHRRYHVEHATLSPSGGLDAAALICREAIFDELGFDPGAQHTVDAIKLMALRNSFDPVRDYLDSLEWDGVPRLDCWLTDYFEAEDNELHRAIGRKVLIAGVRRVRQPGCKFDTIMVLEGKQGTGKSTALCIFAGSDENFTDEPIVNQDSRTQQELLRGTWIVEMAELEGMRKAEVEKVKHFASKTHDRARAAYAREPEDQPRRCIIVGTTNDTTYLRDSTGNRRFWPVATGKIKLEALRADRDQLWAEAAAAEATGEELTLPQHLWGQAAMVQAERLASDPWEDEIAEHIDRVAKDVDGERRISSRMLFEGVLGLPMHATRGHEAKRLAECMRRLGWEGPVVIRLGEKSVRGYRQPAPLRRRYRAYDEDRNLM